MFTGKALVSVDGTNKVLRVGQTYEGYTLKSADSKFAVISYDGVSKKYQLGMAMGALVSKKTKRSSGSSKPFKLTADTRGMYFAEGKINGSPMKFLIDTGATMVTLSSVNAMSLGMDPELEGRPVECFDSISRSFRLSCEIEKYYRRWDSA